MVLFAFLLAPKAAAAAPFCVEAQGIPPQCIYYDTAGCQRQAKQIGGDCTVSPDVLNVKQGLGEYCLVDSSLIIRCVYPDPNSCAAEAARGQGICVANRVQTIQENPYRFQIDHPQ